MTTFLLLLFNLHAFSLLLDSGDLLLDLLPLFFKALLLALELQNLVLGLLQEVGMLLLLKILLKLGKFGLELPVILIS